MKKKADIATSLLIGGLKGSGEKLNYDELAEAIVRAQNKLTDEEAKEKDEYRFSVRSKKDVDAPKYLKVNMKKLRPLLNQL